MLPFGGASMSYAEKNLAPGETIVHRARYHWIYYRTSLAFLLVAAVFGLWWWIAGNRLGSAGGSTIFGYVALFFLAAAVVTFFLRRVRASADEFVVTNRRVMRKVGLFAREAEQAPIEKIQDVTLDQGVIARLLGYGTVVLETASERGRIVFPDISRPEVFRNAIWGQAAGPAAAATATTTVSPSPPPPATPSTAERLKQLEDLRTRGLLSTEEYARKREEILSSL
jgi:membrane protein YdbS with pleckstrin-like domain